MQLCTSLFLTHTHTHSQTLPLSHSRYIYTRIEYQIFTNQTKTPTRTMQAEVAVWQLVRGVKKGVEGCGGAEGVWVCRGAGWESSSCSALHLNTFYSLLFSAELKRKDFPSTSQPARCVCVCVFPTACVCVFFELCVCVCVLCACSNWSIFNPLAIKLTSVCLFRRAAPPAPAPASSPCPARNPFFPLLFSIFVAFIFEHCWRRNTHTCRTLV